MYNVVFDYLITFLVDNSEDNCWIAEQNNVCRYQVSNLYSPSMFDWIGIFKVYCKLMLTFAMCSIWIDIVALFKPNFCSDSDAVTWLYVASSWEDDKNDKDGGYSVQNIIFKKRYMPLVGQYLFGYYSREKNCLLCLSHTFEVLYIKVLNEIVVLLTSYILVF